MRLLLPILLIALAQAQEPPKIAEPTTIPIEQLQKQAAAMKQENERLTRLLNWYKQQFFACQSTLIEEAVAPREVAKPEAKEGSKPK